MLFPNVKTIVISLAALLFASVAHGKCYPGLDCPDDLPNANNTPNQQIPEPKPEPVPPPEEQTTTEIGGIVGRIKIESDNSPEESVQSSKYKKYKYAK
jgi:hypothetical protein